MLKLSCGVKRRGWSQTLVRNKCERSVTGEEQRAMDELWRCYLPLPSLCRCIHVKSMGGKLMGHDADQAWAEREIAQKSAVSYEPHTQRHTHTHT